MIFEDRTAAGRRLGAALLHHVGADVVVLGIPRGGLVVAHAVAESLHATLDVVVTHRIGDPRQPERTVGAVAEGGASFRHGEAMRDAEMSDSDFVAAELHAIGDVERRSRLYRGGRRRIDLHGKVVIVVDEGITTGCSASAAVLSALEHGADLVVIAAPVGSGAGAQDLQLIADDVVVLQISRDMLAVEYWYDDFTTVTDDDVVKLLG